MVDVKFSILSYPIESRHERIGHSLRRSEVCVFHTRGPPVLSHKIVSVTVGGKRLPSSSSYRTVNSQWFAFLNSKIPKYFRKLPFWYSYRSRHYYEEYWSYQFFNGPSIPKKQLLWFKFTWKYRITAVHRLERFFWHFYIKNQSIFQSKIGLSSSLINQFWGPLIQNQLKTSILKSSL